MKALLYGFKELYDLNFKTLQPITLNGRQYESGETVMTFDKMEYMSVEEDKNTDVIKGGQHNIERLYWEESKQYFLEFYNGVFSKEQLAFFNNANISEANNTLYLTKKIETESDENCIVHLVNIQLSKLRNLYIYSRDTKKKIKYIIEHDNIVIDTPYLDVIVLFEYPYIGNYTTIKSGINLYNTYFSLEAKTRVKNDSDGKVVTGILRIPKIRFDSGFKFQLGDGATPQRLSFSAVGVPKSKGESLMEFLILEDDIDADIV